jgi:hypothetical protein
MNLENVVFKPDVDWKWTLILTPNDFEDFKALFDLPSFCNVVKCPEVPKGIDPCYFKCNYFLMNTELVDDDWYGVVCDDNMLSKSVFSKLVQSDKEDKIAIFSELRGTNKIDVAPLVLKAEKGNIGLYRTDLCQYFLRGSVYKNHRFNEKSACADGELIGSIVDLYQTVYYPDDYVYFNVLQPGRWSYAKIEHLL